MIHTLKKAAEVVEKIRRGECDYDLIEVMACPGGCIGGAGQPVTQDLRRQSENAARVCYNADKMMQLHKSQDNHIVAQCYAETLGEPERPDGAQAAAYDVSKSSPYHGRIRWCCSTMITSTEGASVGLRRNELFPSRLADVA